MPMLRLQFGRSLATIAADGTAVTMSGYTQASTDGTADQQLKTDGSGNLSFFTPAGEFTAGNAIEINSGQIDHEDTSSQASVNNSGRDWHPRHHAGHLRPRHRYHLGRYGQASPFMGPLTPTQWGRY